MEYIYAAMLLHKAGQKITEDAVKKVLDGAGVKADAARIKALVAALEGVDIEKAIEKSATVVAPAVAAPAEGGSEQKAEGGKKEEKKSEEEEKKSEEKAAAGLGALFG